MSLYLQQQFAERQSNGAVTEPTGGSWIAALVLHFDDRNEPVNGTWLQALCQHYGITQPLYGSWLIALANHFGITEPENGTWWYPLAQLGTGPQPTPRFWQTQATNWEATADLWEQIPS